MRAPLSLAIGSQGWEESCRIAVSSPPLPYPPLWHRPDETGGAQPRGPDSVHLETRLSEQCNRPIGTTRMPQPGEQFAELHGIVRGFDLLKPLRGSPMMLSTARPI
jgi:hypothetical protein